MHTCIHGCEYRILLPHTVMNIYTGIEVYIHMYTYIHTHTTYIHYLHIYKHISPMYSAGPNCILLQSRHICSGSMLIPIVPLTSLTFASQLREDSSGVVTTCRTEYTHIHFKLNLSNKIKAHTYKCTYILTYIHT